jgi:hypothetical protein
MQARRKVAVAGATGRVGRHLVDVLEADEHDVVPMSRATGVDIVTGDGLADALRGVECVIDVATGPSPEQAAATDLDSAPASVGAPIPEIAGPREENLVDMAMLLTARRGDPVKIEAVSDPSNPETELNESGALLPGPHATLAGPTFEQWLDAGGDSKA